MRSVQQGHQQRGVTWQYSEGKAVITALSQLVLQRSVARKERAKVRSFFVLAIIYTERLLLLC